MSAAYQSLMVFNTDFNPSPSSWGVHAMPRGINWEDQARRTCWVLRPSKKRAQCGGPRHLRLGMAADKSKKCVAPRTVSNRQNLSVGFGVQVPDAFNNAKVDLKIQHMSRGCCPEKKSSRQLQAPAAMAATRTAEAARRPMIPANLSRTVGIGNSGPRFL